MCLTFTVSWLEIKELILDTVGYCCSVIKQSLTLCDPWTAAARPPCPSSSPAVSPNPCPSSRWCHPTTLSSVVPFFSYPRSFQHQSLFQWAGFLHQVTKVLELLLQHQSFQWTFRVGFLAVQGTLKSLLQHHISKASLALSLLYGPTLTSIHDYWKNHSSDYTMGTYTKPNKKLQNKTPNKQKPQCILNAIHRDSLKSSPPS